MCSNLKRISLAKIANRLDANGQSQLGANFSFADGTDGGDFKRFAVDRGYFEKSVALI